MPPKRGRGAARARGTGRGGAAAGRSATGDATDDATLQSTAPTAAADAPAEPVVPKKETEEDAKPQVVGDSVSTTTEAQDSSSVTPGVIDPSNGAEPAARAPVQRLGSLQGAVPPSRSASPSVRGRGSTTRGKRGMVKPTFTGRRSKEDRDALAKEQKDREALRNAERVAADRKKQKDAEFAARREASKAARGRGGFSSGMSGPFSLGSSREDRKNNASRGPSGFGGGSGSRAVRVKFEGEGHAGSSGRSGGGGPSIKREDGGYVSSEEEDDAEFPRQDIDLIEISSDENEDKEKTAPTHRTSRTALPVRIGRKEHQERTFALNTDASSETAAKILEKAEAGGEAPAKVTSDQTSRKGKGKSKDVEITGERKPFRGVWQDADDSGVAVKVEALSDDENMADAEAIGVSEAPPQPPAKQEPASPTTERKQKARIQNITEPILQTDEDRAEWARFQSNLKHIRAELGPDETPAVDAAGDVPMADGPTTAAKKPTVRDNNVYLFQIPPLMPELLPPTPVKSEPAEDIPTPSVKPDPAIKLEDGTSTFTDAFALSASGPRFASGLVGKLRVRQSGRTTLDWGGTSYELQPGNKAGFLQEVVQVQVVPERERVVQEDGGEAVSLGRVKGKFVVVPDWGGMLG